MLRAIADAPGQRTNWQRWRSPVGQTQEKSYWYLHEQIPKEAVLLEVFTVQLAWSSCLTLSWSPLATPMTGSYLFLPHVLTVWKLLQILLSWNKHGWWIFIIDYPTPLWWPRLKCWACLMHKSSTNMAPPPSNVPASIFHDVIGQTCSKLAHEPLASNSCKPYEAACFVSKLGSVGTRSPSPCWLRRGSHALQWHLDYMYKNIICHGNVAGCV